MRLPQKSVVVQRNRKMNGLHEIIGCHQEGNGLRKKGVKLTKNVCVPPLPPRYALSWNTLLVSFAVKSVAQLDSAFSGYSDLPRDSDT